MADSLSLAMLVLLESVSPEQRAVLLFHDVFDYDYPQVAEIIGKSQDSVRQFATRARRHVQQRRPRFQSSREQQQELGALRWPHINKEFVGREEIRAAAERGQGLWDYFVQTTHPGTIQLAGDTAVGRAYIAEFGRFRDGGSQLNYAVYHDRYQRSADGWKFTERVYEVRYIDTTPLAGSAPHPAGALATSGRSATAPPRR
jgi:hypothetical protein